MEPEQSTTSLMQRGCDFDASGNCGWNEARAKTPFLSLPVKAIRMRDSMMTLRFKLAGMRIGLISAGSGSPQILIACVQV